MKLFDLLASVVLLALFHSTANGANECMATLAGPNGYTPTGYFLGGDDNEVTTTVKPGERFIAAPPYVSSEQDNSWRVYLRSGIHGPIDSSGEDALAI